MNISSPMPPRLVIDPRKISLYLLNLNSLDGASKARFFLGWGFDASRPQELHDALVAHACSQNLVEVNHAHAYGPRFVFVGGVQSPRGMTPDVVSVWEVLHGTNYGKFITAYPRS